MFSPPIYSTEYNEFKKNNEFYSLVQNAEKRYISIKINKNKYLYNFSFTSEF
jgi:hypothetical protein